jgi:tetratricopeptide (TPR) repeat protein
MVALHVGAPPAPAVLLSGTVPPLADGYYTRPETGPDLPNTLRPGDTVVLVHGADAGSTPAAQGGTGKTQLAVEFAHAMWNNYLVEVLIWVTASSPQTIIAGFAQAANAVDAGLPGEAAEVAAERFVSWLAHTTRPWALVLDDLADAGDLARLWSPLSSGHHGRIIITARQPAHAFEGEPFDGQDLTVIPVGLMSRREALAYVNSRLNEHPDQRIEALDLAEDLDGLPLALAQATSVMGARGMGCRQYRTHLGQRRKHMTAMDGVSAAVLATWSLAAECADELLPAGMAWPTLALAAMMDHHGVPGSVLTSPAACGYVTGRPATASGPEQNIVRAAINNLAQSGLITIDPASAVRTVQLHASVQAAVRSWLPRTDLEQVMLAAADGLLEAWPDEDAADLDPFTPFDDGPAGRAQLEQALRDCAGALRATDGGLLWKPEAHPLLFRAGLSLEHARLSEAAIDYWRTMLTTATRLLGPGHADAVAARDRLAAAYEAAGRSDQAISVFRAALTDRERNQGAEHADTIAARGKLAHAYQTAGRGTEAVAMYEHMVLDSQRLFGAGNPATLAARGSLAGAYQAAGKLTEAISVQEMLLADAERMLGPGHVTTLNARASLGAVYAENGQLKDAITQYERALGDHERLRGSDHPDAIAARASLASAYRAGGKHKDAIAQCERVLADRERVQGADHADTIAARASLAYAYRSAGRLREAVPHYERTLADRERVQGRDHRDTLTARSNLAACYQQARRLLDAIPQYEQALADSERMLGAGDIETLTTRCNLATAYYTAGRLTDVVAVLQRALSDCERYLGPDDPMTQTVRANLDAATQT